MLAGDRAQREQAFLDGLHAALFRIDRRARGFDFADRLGGLQRRALQRSHRHVQRAARLVGHARQVALRGAQGILDIVRAGQFRGRRVQRLDQLLGMHQTGALLGQFLFLARPWVQLRKFLHRMFQELPVPRRLIREIGGFLCRFGCLAPGSMSLANHGRLAVQPAIAVQQGTVRCRVDQAARFELALDFDQCFADLAQQADAGRLVVDIGAAAPVGAQRPAKHQFAAGVVQPLFVQQRVGRVIRCDFEHGGDHGALGPVPHQSALGSRAQRQPQRIQQYGFARAGLAGQHAKAFFE